MNQNLWNCLREKPTRNINITALRSSTVIGDIQTFEVRFKHDDSYQLSQSGIVEKFLYSGRRHVSGLHYIPGPHPWFPDNRIMTFFAGPREPPK